MLKFVSFQLEEFVTMLIGYKLTNANHVLKLLEFMPTDYNLFHRVITSFNNLYYDKETGILHSISASRVHELRGLPKLIAISIKDSICLLTLAASIADVNSALEILLGDFIHVTETRKKGQRTFKHLHEYIMFIMQNEEKLSLLQAKVIHK